MDFLNNLSKKDQFVILISAIVTGASIVLSKFGVFGGLGSATVLLIVPLLAYVIGRSYQYGFAVYLTLQIAIVAISGYGSYNTLSYEKAHPIDPLPTFETQPVVIEKSNYVKLWDVSNKLNESCPLKIDTLTILDSTSVDSIPLTFQYHFTILSNRSKLNIGFLNQYFKKQGQKVLSSGKMSSMTIFHPIFKYHYKDQQHLDITTIVITPKEYEGITTK